MVNATVGKLHSVHMLLSYYYRALAALQLIMFKRSILCVKACGCISWHNCRWNERNTQKSVETAKTL